MKTKFLALAVLVVAAIGAFAFKAESTKRVGQLWQLTDLSQPFNPAKYVKFTSPLPSCPSETKVCYIDIQASDLIPVGQPNAGQPNVVDDPFSTTDLHDDIVTATSNSLNDPFSGSNMRIIYERN
ncbi:hypothetical protein ABIE26_002961 [Pedobacter africanus]|uniref:hypothetical protein n=1 Tax=Pedobacter africanus TaxID=151894 RepID=UPI003399D963